MVGGAQCIRFMFEVLSVGTDGCPVVYHFASSIPDENGFKIHVTTLIRSGKH